MRSRARGPPGPPRPGDRPEAAICDLQDAEAARRFLGPGYDESVVPLRAWWLMYQGDPSPGQMVSYLATRVPWSPIGSTDVVVFRRRAAP